MKPVLALAVLLLLAAGCGSSQQDRIRAAIRSSPDRQGVRLGVSQIRIARSDPRFATALVRPYDRKGHEAVTGKLAVLERTDRWRVVEIGTPAAYLSCVQTPHAVLVELFDGWCFGARGAVSRLR